MSKRSEKIAPEAAGAPAPLGPQEKQRLAYLEKRAHDPARLNSIEEMHELRRLRTRARGAA